MDKEELIRFLKENLSLDSETHGGSFGEPEHTRLKLMLGEEEISSIYLDD